MDRSVERNMSGLQFLPRFEHAVAELEFAGLGKSDRELLLGYLRRLGNPYRAEILKDKRAYAVPSGDTLRGPQTWKEAHRVLVEYKQLVEGNKALIGALGEALLPESDGGAAQGSGRRGKRGRQAPAVAAIGGDDHLAKICFELRDKGACSRAGCQYDHDPRRIAEARKLKEKGKGKGKGKGDGKNGGDKSGKSEVCHKFLKGECQRGAACRFSHARREEDRRPEARGRHHRLYLDYRADIFYYSIPRLLRALRLRRPASPLAVSRPSRRSSGRARRNARCSRWASTP